MLTEKQYIRKDGNCGWHLEGEDILSRDQQAAAGRAEQSIREIVGGHSVGEAALGVWLISEKKHRMKGKEKLPFLNCNFQNWTSIAGKIHKYLAWRWTF